MGLEMRLGQRLSHEHKPSSFEFSLIYGLSDAKLNELLSACKRLEKIPQLAEKKVGPPIAPWFNYLGEALAAAGIQPPALKGKPELSAEEKAMFPPSIQKSRKGFFRRLERQIQWIRSTRTQIKRFILKGQKEFFLSKDPRKLNSLSYEAMASHLGIHPTTAWRLTQPLSIQLDKKTIPLQNLVSKTRILRAKTRYWVKLAAEALSREGGRISGQRIAHWLSRQPELSFSIRRRTVQDHLRILPENGVDALVAPSKRTAFSRLTKPR